MQSTPRFESIYTRNRNSQGRHAVGEVFRMLIPVPVCPPMTLKHLGGSRTQDIMKMHGVSRTTVVNAIRQTFDGILQEYSIPPFPFEDEDKLQSLADGFRSKSTGGVIKHIVGVMDGYLLRICKACIGKNTGINDPSKYYCRRKYYAINCQVSCDSNRKITSLSMLSPGAVPDTLAFLKSSLYRDLEMNKLPQRFGFAGDNAYPKPVMTPYTRAQMRDDEHGVKDNFNFYFSQLRIIIECVFGMLVNKFPILESALKTRLMRTAVDTFVVCCIIHNLCVDERLRNNDSLSTREFPPGQRLVQSAQLRETGTLSQSDFEYVDLVDEVTAHCRSGAATNADESTPADAGTVDHEYPEMSRKEAIALEIARRGYTRPRAYDV